MIAFDGQADGEWVLSLAGLQALGAKHLAGHPTAVDEAVAAVGPEHLTTLIYTSGTTGRPKGVEIPHRCWTYVGAGAEALGILSAGDLQYLWLPLSCTEGSGQRLLEVRVVTDSNRASVNVDTGQFPVAAQDGQRNRSHRLRAWTCMSHPWHSRSPKSC